jgi:hypothetical protein
MGLTWGQVGRVGMPSFKRFWPPVIVQVKCSWVDVTPVLGRRAGEPEKLEAEPEPQAEADAARSMVL